MALFDQVADAVGHGQHFLGIHIAEGLVHHRLRDVLEIGVLLRYGDFLVNGVQQVLCRVVSSKHRTVLQGDVAIELHHFLNKYRINGDEAVNVACIRGSLPGGREHFGVTLKIRNGEGVSDIQRERQRAVEYGVFLGIAVATVDQFSVRTEFTDTYVPLVGLQCANGAHQATAGTLFGCSLHGDQIGSGTVLPENRRHHLHDAIEMIDGADNGGKTLLTLPVRVGDHANFRRGQGIICVQLMLHPRAHCGEIGLYGYKRFQVEHAVLAVQLCGGEFMGHAADCRKRPLGQIIQDFGHASHGFHIIAYARQHTGNAPQRPVCDALRLGGVILGLRDGCGRNAPVFEHFGTGNTG